MKTVARAIKHLMLKQPYYGTFLCGVVKRFETRDNPTLYVGLDGINTVLCINQEYWNKANDTKKEALILHEAGHICLGHLENYKDFLAYADNNHSISNIAADMAINSLMSPEYFEAMNEDATANFMFNQFPNLPRRQGTKYYITFLKKLKQKGQSGQGQGSSSENQQSDSDNSDSMSQSLNDYDSKSEKDKQLIQNQLMSNEDLHKAFEQAWNKLSESEKELVKTQIEHQMKETAKACGNVPGELAEKLERLLKPKPPVYNWRNYFRRALGVAFDIYQKKTRRKESNRFEDCPGLKLKKKHKVLIGIDTSGSVSNKDFADFFSEIHHVYKSGADIHILECDTAITNEYDYDGKTPSQVTGRGGTDMEPIFEYYKKHLKDYTSLVMFTDGYFNVEDIPFMPSVVWIITADGNNTKYPGTTIYIPKSN